MKAKEALQILLDDGFTYHLNTETTNNGTVFNGWVRHWNSKLGLDKIQEYVALLPELKIYKISDDFESLQNKVAQTKCAGYNKETGIFEVYANENK